MSPQEVPVAPSSVGNSSAAEPSLVQVIVSADETLRNRSLSELVTERTCSDLLEQCELLDAFARESTNLYERVRAYFFLYAIHRYHLPTVLDNNDDDDKFAKNDRAAGIPHAGFQCLQNRQFQQAVDSFLQVHRRAPSNAISSALAKAYYHLGFQTLADQVRRSVQSHPGNDWMYQHPCSAASQTPNPGYRHPFRFVLPQGKILQEQTPVRMDLSHCGWSDIFFLGMDFPQGARVLNASIDLAVQRTATNNNDSSRQPPIPPIDCFLQVVDEPVLRLTSVDLKATVTLTQVSQVFDFASDYLGLLRAGVIASGIVPIGLEEEGSMLLSDIFDTLIGKNKGLHLISRVNDIPKGSRLAVSTNLLGSIIALCMRASGQTQNLIGELTEDERRLVAARAILGEWLGGSGGGWQDSGGLWPGIKLIQGVLSQPNDPEYGTSRGRLLPIHRQLSNVEAPERLVQALQDHLVLVHGGMSQNVGPVLEMVTEKYLLREADEWQARHEALDILDEILDAFKAVDIPKLAELTTRNFFEPLQTIIPWATTHYTETLIERSRERFGDDFLGFWMLGGCSGGGMGFIFKPQAKARALVELQQVMLKTKREMEHALPFAMDPVVYDFSINNHGTMAKWSEEGAPSFTKEPSAEIATEACGGGTHESLDGLLEKLGFDQSEHEYIQNSYRTGLIGLKQNRLPLDTSLENVSPDDVVLAHKAISPEIRAVGLDELKRGTVGVVTLAAGVGSRWTQGAGCVKAIHPFAKLGGRHRSFLEIHLAKSRRISDATGTFLPHIVTTSHMTQPAIQAYLERESNHGYDGPLYISHGKSIGVRLVPTVSDLEFAWEQQAKLDLQAEKVRQSGRNALKSWAKSCGEASDYRDNLPLQCLHPVGHFYEVPNLILNGTLRDMLQDRPQLKYLMLHNVDTVGADVDPGLLGLFVQRDATLGFEVIPRHIEDVGGGLARVDGKTRLVEGMALPREEDEFKLSYYNSMTTWIDIDKLLVVFGLDRSDLGDAAKVSNALRAFSPRLPTYVALKEVKKRWGHGHEDVFPTVQFEKLWSDMASLEDVACDYYVVPRERGSQLKDVSQLDGWLRDGAASFLETICSWEA